jgi:hypothetical protein
MGERPVRQRVRAVDGRRDRVVMLRLSEGELADVARAAAGVGLTVSGFAGEAAVRAARDVPPPRADPLVDRLRELRALETQVVRVGTNLNQAVAKLHATGDVPEGLEEAVGECRQVLAELDRVARVAGRQVRR